MENFAKKKSRWQMKPLYLGVPDFKFFRFNITLSFDIFLFKKLMTFGLLVYSKNGRFILRMSC
jgi:hypothetical protein